MYEAYYGLKAKPFELHPDPEYLYMSPGHERVYAYLRFAIREAKGLAVITGEIGSGKTTLLNLLLRELPKETDAALISTPAVPPAQFLKLVCRRFEIDVRGMDKADLLDGLGQYLRAQRRANRRAVLVVDEAQNLPGRTIEEIRLLSNLEAESERVLQILLVGQPELRRKLKERGMEQVLQRVSVHCHLDPLSLDELRQYVRHRLTVAGAADPGLFDEDALSLVHRHSGGIPRLANALCDTALVFGYGEERSTIDAGLIEDVVKTRQAGSLLDAPPSSDGPTPELPGVPSWKTEMEEQVFSLSGRVRELETGFEHSQIEQEKARGWIRQLALISKEIKKRLRQLEGLEAPTESAAEAAPTGGTLRSIFGGKRTNGRR